MDVTATPIDGVLLVKPRVFRDDRGCFMETWQSRRYEEAGIAGPFVQDNHSCSVRGVLRGIHFQRTRPQGKLISVSLGRVYDVAVDLRPQSPTFGRWFGTELSEENHHQLWLAPGMGHAFLVLSETAHFHYKCTDYYVPGDEGTIIWNDPELAIAWPLEAAGRTAGTPPVLSAKDAAAPGLSQWRNDLLRHAR